jgi:hypothetical protein
MLRIFKNQYQIATTKKVSDLQFQI